MKRIIRSISYLLLIVSLLPMLSGCNNEDDVIAIFTGKTWKLTYISADGSNKQFDFWNGDSAAREKSMDALGQEGNFILNFEGSDVNGAIGGSFGGRGISSSVDGTWNANGESNELKINLKGNPSERDALAKAFITGLRNAFRYDGDINNLYIYYKDGQTTKMMSFHPLR